MTESNPDLFHEQISDLLNQNEPDFSGIENLAVTKIAEIKSAQQIFNSQIALIKSELQKCAHFPETLFPVDFPSQMIPTFLHKSLESALHKLSSKQITFEICEIFLKFNSIFVCDLCPNEESQNRTLPTLPQFFSHYINFQDYFGMVSELLSQEQEPEFIQFIFQTKLNSIEEQIKQIILQKYIDHPDDFATEFSNIDISISIFEKILSFFFGELLKKNWESNSILQIQNFLNHFSKIYNGIFQEKLRLLLEKFLTIKAETTISEIAANEIDQSQVQLFFDKLGQFQLGRFGQTLRLKVLTESSLTNFNKLISVKTTFFNFFFQNDLSFEDFQQYLFLNLPGPENAYQILKLETKPENAFFVQKYVFNFYVTFYKLLGFCISSNNRIQKDTWDNIDSLLGFMFQKLNSFEDLKGIEKLLQMHAHTEFAYWEFMQKKTKRN